MAVQLKISKQLVQEEKESKESLESSASVISSNNLNAPKHGTVIPNRVFVGGISSATTEHDLAHLFSSYGNVTGTKIIQDRAGVSKGYGFVTFETEDEAKRLQKEADNIVFKDRRLNIAPAIKKQGFSRGGYDCTTPSPIPCTSQVYRHNGVTFTFHNGMAFFPQPPPPAPQTVPQTAHVEPSPVFQQGGASYGPVGPSSPGPAYPFSYAPQGQVYYQAPPYQYHLPQYDGCYDASQVMVADGSLVVPQYYNYIAPQPTHEIYFQPTPIHTQDPTQSVQPIIYASPRAYDSTIVYTEPKCGMDNGMGSQSGGLISKEEADCSNHPTSCATVSTTTAPTLNNTNNTSNNNNRRSRETTPVVSLLKIKDYKEQQLQGRRKQHQTTDDGRRHFHLNNNNPDATNRNLKQHEQQRGGECRRSPPPPQYSGGHGSRPPVPQYPFYPRQILAPPSNLPSYYQHPPPPAAQPLRPRSYYHRPRYNGGGRGRGGKWISKEEEVGNPLTPPITPRSESTSTATTTVTQSDDVVQSIQALAI